MRKGLNFPLACGMLGCLCFGGGDWLMIYGDTATAASLYWLTDGVARIAPWRNTLALALSFPGILLYGIALFALGGLIREKPQERIYHYLNVFGLTPWLSLHLFYIMILYLFAWMRGNGLEDAAIPTAEALYGHFSWFILVSEAIMLPPFLYWFYLVVRGKTRLPKIMAVSNPLAIYAVLYFVKFFLPDSAFRIGFTNGLMSESMLLWFAVFFIWNLRNNDPTPNALRKGAWP